ncbi:SRPBCC family protein [Sphingoaurantiacus capsulatus]|uniref:SRPBCC family protein n=1 Tax=Sphingoaurantiacus capsulatus TaxID=1771310 RepID=A0ABV7X6Z5_9SPHN
MTSVPQRDDAPPTTARDDDRSEALFGDEFSVIGRTVTINRPREEVYAFWRDFANLATVMENVERIDVTDKDRSHWVVKAPGGKTVEWDAVVTDDILNQLIGWRSTEEADVDSRGHVEFLDAAPGRGTMVRATIAYDPPAGVVGQWIAKFLQREPNLQARRDLRRLKQFLETGEVTSSASPSGRPSESATEQAL